MIEVLEIKDIYNDKDIAFVDVRSPGEFEDDHIFGAINMPILTDKERHEVGYTYKNESKDEAIRKGIKYASYKIIDYYDEVEELINQGKKVVFYCFRGGMRSNSIAKTMTSLNKKVYLLKGGYKEYRKFAMEFIDNIPDTCKFIMVHGLTGVGKTHILKGLREKGEQVLDLEYLARNRGSVFGKIGYEGIYTTQKMFESEIVRELSDVKGDKIYVESESQRIGNVNVPAKLFETMKTGKHYLMETSTQNRVKILMEDYMPDSDEKLENFNKTLKEIIENLRKAISNARVDELNTLIDSGNYSEFTSEMLVKYYDPLYQNSIDKYQYDSVVKYETIEEAVLKLIKLQNIK